MPVKVKHKQTVKLKHFPIKRNNTRGYIGFIILLIVVLGVLLAGAFSAYNNSPTPVTGTLVDTSPQPGSKNSLQLRTLNIVSISPTTAVQPALCKQGGVNDEPTILAGYSPANNQSVGAGGQIKVWVSDEHAPCIGTGETADPNTGAITPGNRTEKAPDGYLWEPALYIAPQTAENGGSPNFPSLIKGQYDNGSKIGRSCESGHTLKGPAIDPIPAGFPPPAEPDYQDEYIWDVNSLNLSPGTYQAEFVIHDGDDNRGVGCVNITIQ